MRTATDSAVAARRVTKMLEHGVDVALQPIIDLDRGEVVSVEALARFSDGRSPDEWFAEAASVGLNQALELAAVRSALGRLGELPPGTRLAVNVSAATAASPELAELLDGVPAGRVVLEITEHVAVADYVALAGALEGLRARGVHIAVDDAGAGFASMRHVLRLHPDVVKLDISLVRGIDADPAHRALVSALVSFARETHTSLVAEGIETAAELEAARALGVGCAQGFHLGRPEQERRTGWNISLPRRKRVIRPGAVGRFVRPAAALMAAALAWPGIVAVAGLDRSGADVPVERPPATAPREDPGGSASSAATTRRPATVRTSAPVPKTPATPATTSPTSGEPTNGTVPVAGTVNTVLDVTDEALGAVGGVVNAVDQPVGGLLGGLLGARNR
jgi:EAL domain-containing protein (putative c-di-GMP-specific phosphodiesterase class I)